MAEPRGGSSVSRPGLWGRLGGLGPGAQVAVPPRPASACTLLGSPAATFHLIASPDGFDDVPREDSVLPWQRPPSLD